MLKRSFFGLSKPSFKYETLTHALPDPVKVPVPEHVTLYIKKEITRTDSSFLKIGDPVKTGQILKLSENDGEGVVSSVTGKIVSIAPFSADFGKTYTAVKIQTDADDAFDEDFAAQLEDPTKASFQNLFSSCPGQPPLENFLDPDEPVRTIVVYGGDTDLLIDTSLYFLKMEMASINEGIKVLRKVTGVNDIAIVAPKESVQNYSGHQEARIEPVSSIYPYAQPLMIVHQLTGALPEADGIKSTGICFIKAEAVAAMGKAFTKKQVVFEKAVTVIDKKGEKHLAVARLGTPIGDIFKKLNIEVQDLDKIIFGGPMTGSAVYSEDLPIGSDTDAIIVQDKDQVAYSTDYPCINCGDCVRICPANVPVNMLVRFLEAGQYQDGADLYDLYSCIECGLCSFVCVSRIPIFQYIKLAKHELGRINSAEEMNE